MLPLSIILRIGCSDSIHLSFNVSALNIDLHFMSQILWYWENFVWSYHYLTFWIPLLNKSDLMKVFYIPTTIFNDIMIVHKVNITIWDMSSGSSENTYIYKFEVWNIFLELKHRFCILVFKSLFAHNFITNRTNEYIHSS